MNPDSRRVLVLLATTELLAISLWFTGTAALPQLALGFLLTSLSVRVVAAVGEHWGWRWAGPVMAIGPLLGILAIMRLRTAPAD